MIPLGHDFTGERVLVFGGGPVGARKARTFAREAETVVVSPAFADRSFGDATLVRAAPEASAVADWVERTRPALVVAATDDDRVNTAAARAAGDCGALCVRADRSATDTTDDAETNTGDTDGSETETSDTTDDANAPDANATGRDASDTETVGGSNATADRSEPHRVTTLATVRDEPVVVAVGTGGVSPALSRELRRRIEPVVAGAGAMAELLGELRPEAKRRGEPSERRAAMRAVAASAAVWKGLRTGASNARAEARRLLEEHV
ncbi:MAG: bifunctional precorrin-2 dehydrogenase/sirohydrochlorin ferrochelatase [Halobaculum sp.]